MNAFPSYKRHKVTEFISQAYLRLHHQPRESVEKFRQPRCSQSLVSQQRRILGLVSLSMEEQHLFSEQADSLKVCLVRQEGLSGTLVRLGSPHLNGVTRKGQSFFRQ